MLQRYKNYSKSYWKLLKKKLLNEYLKIWISKKYNDFEIENYYDISILFISGNVVTKIGENIGISCDSIFK